MELFKILGKIAVDSSEADRAIDETTGKAEKSESRMTSAFKKIGAAVVACFAIDKIKDFGQACVDMTAEVAAEQSAFEQIMGNYSGEAQEKLNEIADATGMVNTRLTPYMTSMTAKFKGLGYDIGEATDYAQRGLTMASDAAAFWDMSLDESTSHLNSFVNGSYEGGEAIGLFANDTQMAAYAVEQGLISDKKEWANLEEKIKQATRLDYAENMMKQSGAVGQAAKESNQYANVQANLNEKWRQFKAQIGEPILQKIVLPAMKKLGNFITNTLSPKFEYLKQKITENKDKLLLLKDKLIMLKDKFIEFGKYLIDTFSPAFSSIKELFETVAGAVKPYIENLLGISDNSEKASGTSDKLKSVIGFVADAVKFAADKMSEFVEWLGGGSRGVTVLKTAVFGITAAFIAWKAAMAITSVVSRLKNAIIGLKAAIIGIKSVMLANPIALIVAGIAALVAAFVVLWKKCDGFREFWLNIWDNIKSAAAYAWEFIKSVWNDVSPYFSALWNKIKEDVTTVWNTIKNIFSSAWDFVKSVWDKAKPYFPAIWQGIKNVFSVVKTFIGGAFSSALVAVTAVWDTAAGYFQSVWNTIKGIFSVVKSVLSGNWNDAWEAIKGIADTWKDYFQGVWNGIKSVFSTVKSWFGDTFSAAWETIKAIAGTWGNYFQGVWDNIKSTFGAVKSWFGDTFGAAWEAVKNIFAPVGEFFGGLWDTIKDKFSSLGTSIADAIGGSVKTGINGIISMIESTINKAVDLINGALELADSIIPGDQSGWEVGSVSLPRLAQGGIVDRATIAQIGEDGPEAVVPLKNNTEWIDRVAEKVAQKQGKGGNLTVNYFLENVNMNSDSDIEENMYKFEAMRKKAELSLGG